MRNGLKMDLTKRDPRSIGNQGLSPDYFVNTMQLRKLALSGRQQTGRSSRYLKSAPPFQNRTLENYPMPHGREEVVRSAHGQRSERQATAARMSRARVDSGSMSEYCKHMFDFTVYSTGTNKNLTINSARDTKYRTRRCERSKSETSYSNKTDLNGYRTNGPTPDGSTLHNHKQKVLNDIRIRTPHVYENDKPRACSRNNLQDTISEKNKHYRVLSVSGDSRQGSAFGTRSISSSEMVFVPINSCSNGSDLFCRAAHNSSRQTFDPSMSEYLDTESIATHDPFDDNDEKSLCTSDDFRPLTQSTRPSSSATTHSMMPPTTACSIRLVSLDEETSSEEEEEPEVEAVEEKKPEPPPPPVPASKSGTK